MPRFTSRDSNEQKPDSNTINQFHTKSPDPAGKTETTTSTATETRPTVCEAYKYVQTRSEKQPGKHPLLHILAQDFFDQTSLLLYSISDGERPL